ncbi:radical SAM protein [Chloroflexota bacterium]
MNIYHITYVPRTKSAHLYFWGCNLNCRACVRLKEMYDYHLKDRVSNSVEESPKTPERFLALEEVISILRKLDMNEVIFMGAEPSIDPRLPQLAEVLHQEFGSHNILLTNGLKLFDPRHIDEVVFSLKAPTDTLHKDYTRKSNKEALKNFLTLYQSNIKLRTESVFIPEYIDGSETENIARFIAGVDKHIPYRIDAYIPVVDNPWRQPTPEEMEKAISISRKYLHNVSYLSRSNKLKYDVVRIF